MVDFPIKIVIFHSYVKLPDGISRQPIPMRSGVNWRLLHSLDLDRVIREGDVDMIQAPADACWDRWDRWDCWDR